MPPRASGAGGFTLPELLVSLVVAAILAALAVPAYDSAVTGMRLNSTASALAGAISRARYQAIMTSQTYTFAVSEPSNSYVVTNVSTGISAAAVPLPTSAVAVNGNAAATYTFTFSPNGTVSPIQTLALTYKNRETDVTVSGVGNVTTKLIR